MRDGVVSRAKKVLLPVAARAVKLSRKGYAAVSVLLFLGSTVLWGLLPQFWATALALIGVSAIFGFLWTASVRARWLDAGRQLREEMAEEARQAIRTFDELRDARLREESDRWDRMFREEPEIDSREPAPLFGPGEHDEESASDRDEKIRYKLPERKYQSLTPGGLPLSGVLIGFLLVAPMPLVTLFLHLVDSVAEVIIGDTYTPLAGWWLSAAMMLPSPVYAFLAFIGFTVLLTATVRWGTVLRYRRLYGSNWRLRDIR